MYTLRSRIAFLDSRIKDLFPGCIRVDANVDVAGKSVRAINASYKILRNPRIRRVDITVIAGGNPVIKIIRR
jgi:hypothetical protein